MGNRKKAPNPAMSNLADDLAEPGSELLLPALDGGGSSSASGDGAFSFEDEATGRVEAHPLDPLEAPLEAPAPEATVSGLVINLPAAVLVVDRDRRRGAQTAARLMEHGYTCRVVAPADAAGTLSSQSFEAVLLEASDWHGPDQLRRTLAALSEQVPAIVVSTPAAVEVPSNVALLLKPWFADQAVRAVEQSRETSRRSSASATLDVAEHGHGFSDTGNVEDAVPWESFLEKVVRARIADVVGGFAPARVRGADYDGIVAIECRRPLLPGDRYVVGLSLADGRRADFGCEVRSPVAGDTLIAVEVESTDTPFFHAWVEESADPLVNRVEPVLFVPQARAEADRPQRPSQTPDKASPAAATSASSAELDGHWEQAKARLDDEEAQQRFIQACVRMGELEMAVGRYRALKEGPPGDPRAERYLAQVGTILGFYALQQSGAELNDAGLSSRLKLMLGLFILAAIILLVFAALIR